ncbi:MAG TPA: hypothetical protein VFI96_07125 [Longimicrobiaceae bacterium]|nr:hypothetical protein [Longimicrobiaceae bacterium]
MANSAQQNPMFKVGRNSGAGPTGVSRLQPSAREAARGLDPMSLDEPARGLLGKIGMGLGVVGMVGAGVALYAARQVKKQKSFRGRLERLVGRG